jgi:hypothetical protein
MSFQKAAAAFRKAAVIFDAQRPAASQQIVKRWIKV